jgi:hypothetical protein
MGSAPRIASEVRKKAARELIGLYQATSPEQLYRFVAMDYDPRRVASTASAVGSPRLGVRQGGTVTEGANVAPPRPR